MMMRQLQITVMVPSEFKSCHDNVIIFNTFTLPFSVVISHILVVMTYIISGINYINLCIFIIF